MVEERYFADVVQELYDEKKTGALYVSVVETSEDLLRIYFKDGDLYHIRYGSAIGNDCLDIIEFYTLWSATFFEGIRAPGTIATGLPKTGEILAFLKKLNKKVKVK